MTPKQWHRYLIQSISNIVKDHINGSSVFIECGVKQGSSSVIMAVCLGVQGYLFDTWKGFPDFSNIDAPSEKSQRRLRKRIKRASDTHRDCVDNLSKNNVNKMCSMIQGDILKTVPDFTSRHGDLSVVMMHIDTDLYQPAQISLDCFWPLVRNSGVVYFHDYGDKKWRGIKKVVDELVEKDNDLLLHVFDPKKLRSACIVKGKNDLSSSIIHRIERLDNE